MNTKRDKQGRIVNPCVQIDTSVFAMNKNGTALTTSQQTPKFMTDKDEPLNIFRDVDPLYNADLDPFEIEKMRDAERSKETTSAAAQNINAVIP